MLFVGLYSVKPGASLSQSLQKRIDWKPPEGIKVIAEYWLQHDNPHTVVIFQADSFAPMMASSMVWREIFDITIVPAITGEEGLKIAKQMKPKT
jgi:hypothetical protein